MAEHTPTPWYLVNEDGTDFTAISTKPKIDGVMDIESEVLGTSEWLRIEADDLRFIVRAVNAHDALVAALEAVQRDGKKYRNVMSGITLAAVDAALALARGEG